MRKIPLYTGIFNGEYLFLEMDTALDLKIKYDKGGLNIEKAQKMLGQSELFEKLLGYFEFSPLNLLWRLNAISEIPFAGNHDKVKGWLSQLIKLTSSKDGFSLTGKHDYLLPCYNAMITSILIKLKSPESVKIKVGIDWIMKYQNVERNKTCGWKGSGVKKYGGCMKNTPCYVGVVKSMIALSAYKYAYRTEFSEDHDKKLKKGLEYILDQEVYIKKSDSKPITKYITSIAYPFTWKTNIVEILRLLKQNNLLEDDRCTSAKNYLLSKRKKDGKWRIQSSYIMKNKSWVSFDKIGEPGAWVSNEIEGLV